MCGPRDTNDFLAGLDATGDCYRGVGADWKMRAVSHADHGTGLSPLREGAKGRRYGLDGSIRSDVADNCDVDSSIHESRRKQGLEFFHVCGLHLLPRRRNPTLVAIVQNFGRL